MAVFRLPRPGAEASFFDLPWPTDLRRDAAGHPDVLGFPNPAGNRLVDSYLTAISTRLDGWGTNGSVYFRFSDPVDPASLPPVPPASLAPDASVFLLDVDPASPEHGQRRPVVAHYRDESTTYWPSHALAVRPVYGMPLRPGTRYAAVVTTKVRPMNGGEFTRDSDLSSVLNRGGDGTVAAARAVMAPSVSEIEAAGTPRSAILALAVFTTQDAVGELFAARDFIIASYPTPAASDWRWVAGNAVFTEVRGSYAPTPCFQVGPSPYDTPGSGEIIFRDGTPVVARDVPARFALTIPALPMPAGGFPIVLYAHGTSGDYRSFIGNGTARRLAEAGYATMSIDQVLHGDRNPTPSDPALLFFNILNPFAGRDNNRQAALDVVQQARLVPTLRVPLTVIDRGAGPLRFDASRIYVFGHSQGGLNLPLFLAADNQTHGGVLSAAGGTLIIAVLQKKAPIDIALAVHLLLRFPGSSAAQSFVTEHFVAEHPVQTIYQTWVEAADPVNYGRYLFAEPRPGFPPKSILQTQGEDDRYTPPDSGATVAAAAHMPIIEPVARAIEALTLQGIAPQTAPVTGNVAGGQATAGLLQFPGEGHFLVFSNASAQHRIGAFFNSFGAAAPTIVPAP